MRSDDRAVGARGSSRSGSSRRSGSWRPARSTSSSSSPPSSTTASTRDVTRQAAYDVSDPTPAEVSVGRPGSRPRPCETAVAVRYHERPRRPAGWPSSPTGPGFVWQGPSPTATDRRARLRQAQGAADQSVAAPRRFGLPAAGLPRRDRPAARPGRRPAPSSPIATPPNGASWSIAWSTAPSSPISGPSSGPTCCGTKRRRWARRAPGSSSAGCATRSPRDVPLDDDGPPDRRRPGLDLAESAVELPPDQPRPDDRRRERRPGLPRASGSSAPGATTTRSTSGPRTITTAWPPSSPTSPASSSTTSARTDSTSTRSTATRSFTCPAARGWSSRGPAPSCNRGACTASPGSGRRRRRERPRPAGRLADARQSASSAGTWPIGSGSTCSAGGSSTRSMISASRIRPPTPRSSTR